MHILICAEWLSNYGGSEMYALTTIRLASQLGIKLTVAIVESEIKQGYAELLNEWGIEYHLCPGGTYMQQEQKLSWLLSLYEKKKCTLLHFIPSESLSYKFLEASRDCPVIVSETTDASNEIWWLPENYSSLIRNANAVTAVSQSAAYNLREVHGAINVFVIPPTIIDLGVIERDTVDNEYLRDVDIAYVGRLSEEKGLEFLLGAMTQVLKHRPETTLALYGDGPDAARLQAIAQMLRIDHKLIFYGPFSQSIKRQIYQKCKIIILPSLIEGLPLCLLEAMSNGRAFISTNVGGIPELIVGQNDHLVNPGCSEQLAARILHFLSPKKLSQLERLVKIHFAEYYDPKNTADAINDCYRDIHNAI